MTTQMVGNASSFRLPMAMSNCSCKGQDEEEGDKGARNVLTMWPRLDAQAARATHKHKPWTPASEPRVSFGFPFPLQCVAAIMQMLLSKGKGWDGKRMKVGRLGAFRSQHIPQLIAICI